jgi:hypothetical protein
MSVDMYKQLTQDSAIMGHGSDLPGLYDLFAKSLYHHGALRADFTAIFMRQL